MTPGELIDQWLDQGNGGHPSFEMIGISLEDARQILRGRNPLLTIDVPSGTFEEASRGLRPFIGTLLERLVRLEELAISINLQDVLDRGLYNPRLSDLFEKLWAARFQHLESRDPKAILDELMRETFEERSTARRCDALLFWLTLMGQNYSIVPGQLNLMVRGYGDDDLTLLLLMSEAWNILGCPLRVLILS